MVWNAKAQSGCLNDNSHRFRFSPKHTTIPATISLRRLPANATIRQQFEIINSFHYQQRNHLLNWGVCAIFNQHFVDIAKVSLLTSQK